MFFNYSRGLDVRFIRVVFLLERLLNEPTTNVPRGTLSTAEVYQ